MKGGVTVPQSHTSKIPESIDVHASTPARAVIVCLLLAAATTAVYAPVIGHDFVDYDDELYVLTNTHVQAGLTWDTVRWAWTTGHTGYWHPLTWMSLARDVEMYGVTASGFHLSNVLFHVLNTLLLFGILIRTTRRIGPSACVAALFALHPLHVESVAWVAERKDVLSAALGLLSIAAYVRYARCRSGVCYALTFFLLALSLCAKPMLVTLPFVYLLLDYWPLKRKNKSVRFLLLEKLPFLALSALLSVVTYLGQENVLGKISFTYPKVALPLRIANAAVSYVRYITKTFWPVDLSVLYPHPYAAGMTPWSVWTVVASAALLGGLCVLLLWAARRRYAAVGWLWYLGMLVPAIGVVQSGIQGMADRYTYLPLVGLFVIAAWGGSELVARFTPRRTLAAAAAIALIGACAVASARQVPHWRNSKSLYEQALRATPRNPVIITNLGLVLQKQEDTQEAIRHFRRALEIWPQFDVAAHKLGKTLRAEGRKDEAIQTYRAFLEARPESAVVHHDLAEALEAQGDDDGALHHYLKALELRPDRAAARFRLGGLLTRLERWEDAAAQWRRLVQTPPFRSDAHYHLGRIHRRQNRFDDAVREFRSALRFRPDHAGALNDLGLALQSQGRPSVALATLRRAVKVSPQSADTHHNLANVLSELGLLVEAVAHYRLAVHHDGSRGLSHYLLGEALRAVHDAAGAVEAYRSALAIDPDDTDGHHGMALALVTLNRAEEAAGHFERIVTVDPDRPSAHYNLAVCLNRLGRSVKAIEHYRLELERQPDNVPTLYNLALLLSAGDQHDEAIALYNAALRVAPDSPAIHVNLAKTYAGAGRFDLAVQSTQRALDLASKAGMSEQAAQIRETLELYKRRSQ